MKILKSKRNITVLISWMAVLLWMLGIFMMSAQVAEQSDNLSLGITETLIGTVENSLPDYDFDIYWFNFLIRKNAHFITYLVLGVLVMNALYRSGFKGMRIFILSLVICMLYAVSDEVHQLFVPGRGGRVADVLLDSSGAFAGLGIFQIINKLKGSP